MFAPDPMFTSIISSPSDFIKIKDYIFRKDKIMKISKDFDFLSVIKDKDNCFMINIILHNSDKTTILYDTEQKRDEDFTDVCLDLGIPEDLKEDDE